MHSLLKGVVLIFGLALASCTPVPLCPAPTKEQAKEAEIALADFAVNLFRNVSDKSLNKNQVMSPVSIALALALLENGADGPTRQQLRNTLLEVGAHADVLTTYRAVQKHLRIDDEKTKLTIANGLFQDKDLKLNEKYMTTTRDCLETEVDNKNDFANQLEQARQKINKWVSDKTNGKIPELFKEGVLTEANRMVLANAIYFKASWQHSFNKAMTKDDTFYRNGHERQTVPFMHATASHHHVSTNDLDALEMSYEHPDLSMVVVLPKARDGLHNLEQRLTGKELRGVIQRMEQRRVEVKLPKFTVRSPIDLKDVLIHMGLDSIFGDKANFSRMSEEPLKVDSAIHEAYITVEENGTEGAAATGISIVNRAMPLPPNLEDLTLFVADHPFLYAVVHKPTGAIIFLGKVHSVESQ
jgi:serpin B